MSALAVIAAVPADRTAFASVFAAAGVAVAVLAVYLVVLAVAALFYRGYRSKRGSSAPPSADLVVLIPAHNEADFIGRCVQSLAAQTYPRARYEIVVIADNCTDATDAIARAAGAQVLVRDQPDVRGKGQALRWAMDQLVARSPAPDGVVVVDADSVAEPDFLACLVKPLEDGADAVQGESLLSEGDTPQTALRAAAFLLINRVRPSGRAVLRLPCNLAGNGMLLSRDLLVAHPWSAFTSAEDLEYSIELRTMGVRPVFARGAILHSPAIVHRQAAEQQRLRWEGGKLHVARTRIPRLIGRAFRNHRPSLLEAALDLAVPPLSLLAGGAAAGTAAGAVLLWTGVIPTWALLPWLIASASIPLFVLIGLPAARAPSWAYRSMARAPMFVVAKLSKTHHLFKFRANTWVRGQRPSDAPEPINPGVDVVDEPIRHTESG